MAGGATRIALQEAKSAERTSGRGLEKREKAGMGKEGTKRMIKSEDNDKEKT